MPSMDVYECEGCHDRGVVDASDAVDTDLILLAEDDEDGSMWCLPCWCKRKSVCIHCFSEGDISPDTKCNAEPMLCADCLNLPYRIHAFSCYIDGCMTPGEYAAEEVRCMELDAIEGKWDEGEEWKNGCNTEERG